MPLDIKTLVREEAQAWSGVAPPNQTSEELAESLSGLIAGLTATRGELAFENEPSSFDAVLLAVKEPTP